MPRGLHPILDVRRSLTECIRGAEGLESGLFCAAMAKVLGNGDSDRVAYLREHCRCAHQAIPARRCIRNALLCIRRPLEVYETAELGLEVTGRHLDAPIQRDGIVLRSRSPKSVDTETERHRLSSRSTSRFFSSMRATVSLPSARRFGGSRAAASCTITCARRCGSPGC